ncbi:hypothetical protein STEG23_018589, partial [Scotinomys teguina]
NEPYMYHLVLCYSSSFDFITLAQSLAGEEVIDARTQCLQRVLYIELMNMVPEIQSISLFEEVTLKSFRKKTRDQSPQTLPTFGASS